MANLVITIIAIALVAIAALMGAYYGGRAFLQGRAKAYANTLVSQAQQIVSAWTLYATNNGGNFQIANINALKPSYLDSIPVIPEELRLDLSIKGGSGMSNWIIDNLDSAFTDGTGNPSTSGFNGIFVQLAKNNPISVDVCNLIVAMASGTGSTPTSVDASMGNSVDLLTTSKKFDCVFYSYEGNPSPTADDDMYVYYRAR